MNLGGNTDAASSSLSDSVPVPAENENPRCANPACGSTTSYRNYWAKSALIPEGKLCNPCARYEGNHNVLRPLALIQRAAARAADVHPTRTVPARTAHRTRTQSTQTQTQPAPSTSVLLEEPSFPARLSPQTSDRTLTVFKRRKLEEEPQATSKINVARFSSPVQDSIVVTTDDTPHEGSHSPAPTATSPVQNVYIDVPLAHPSTNPDPPCPTCLKRRRSISPLPSAHNPLSVGPVEERSPSQPQAISAKEYMPMPLVNAETITTAGAGGEDRGSNGGGPPAFENEIEEGEIPEAPVAPVPCTIVHHFPGRHVFFATSAAHPSMPTNPEASGSLYPLAAEIPDGPFTIFRAHMVENGQIAGWEYFGEYTHETVGQMIPELYGAIGHLFQQQWASNIRSDEASLAVRRIRARIALRKAGAPITAAAVDAEANTARLPLISKDDVIRAFKCGQEHHDHIRVKCVSYDQALVANMAAAYPEWLRVTKFRNANKTKKGKEKKK